MGTEDTNSVRIREKPLYENRMSDENNVDHFERLEIIKNRLVCTGREEELGSKIPLTLSTVNKEDITLTNRVQKYESLNKEIAYWVSCYKEAKPISLKAFFIEEAHLTSEWLMSEIDNDFFSGFTTSNLNREELKIQQESINNIRDELYSLLLHPAFSSVNMVPVRILRLPSDRKRWTPWQTANFDMLLDVYSHHFDDHGTNDDYDSIRSTFDSSIVFIYDEKREKHRKPINRELPLETVIIKYKGILQKDPTFLKFFDKTTPKKTESVKKTIKREFPEETFRRKNDNIANDIENEKEREEYVVTKSKKKKNINSLSNFLKMAGCKNDSSYEETKNMLFRSKKHRLLEREQEPSSSLKERLIRNENERKRVIKVNDGNRSFPFANKKSNHLVSYKKMIISRTLPRSPFKLKINGKRNMFKFKCFRKLK